VRGPARPHPECAGLQLVEAVVRQARRPRARNRRYPATRRVRTGSRDHTGVVQQSGRGALAQLAHQVSELPVSKQPVNSWPGVPRLNTP